MRMDRRESTPVCIDARASTNLESASFHIKGHRSILSPDSPFLVFVMEAVAIPLGTRQEGGT